jgi:hypothetical protein
MEVSATVKVTEGVANYSSQFGWMPFQDYHCLVSYCGLVLQRKSGERLRL